MSSLPPDPYKILGVAKDAQIPEIRSAHRKLVLKCHPDKIQDPQLKAEKQDEFQKVQQAYELLSDERERSRYDDQVKLQDKLAELRRQKANSSSTRSPASYAEYDIRNVEPRSAAYHSSPSATKSHSYSRSWEEDYGTRIFEEYRPRREQTFSEKPPRRESQRERDSRDREKDRGRDRQRKAEEEYRRYEKDVEKAADKAADKLAKEARRMDKKAKEKLIAKERKRETEDKRKANRPYIEPYEEDSPGPRSDKKKSSSKKYDDQKDRDRSSQREEYAIPSMNHDGSRWADKTSHAAIYAQSYIYASKSNGAPSLQRAKTYFAKPPAPTPPQATQPFSTPDEEDDVRRSSAAAKIRRGSSDTVRSSREKASKRSNERLDEPRIVNTSPSTVHAAQFQRTAGTTPPRHGSPPRHLPRRETMPADPTYSSRSAPSMSRAQTFNVVEPSAPRGRSRSKYQPQIEETDSEEEYERRRSHRSRRERTPELSRTPEREQVFHYQVPSSGRSKLYNSYTPNAEAYNSYSSHPGTRVVEAIPIREPSSRARFSRVKQNPVYSLEDAQAYTAYVPQYREELSTTSYG